MRACGGGEEEVPEVVDAGDCGTDGLAVVKVGCFLSEAVEAAEVVGLDGIGSVVQGELTVSVQYAVEHSVEDGVDGEGGGGWRGRGFE